MKQQRSIREYLKMFDEGAFNCHDVTTQINAGWYDWFCRKESLRNKTYLLTAKLKKIINSPKINQDTMYVFFKNNCPCYGSLYDDFRICDIKSGDVIYTIIPRSGFDSKKGVTEIWGNENEFKEPIVSGTWKDAMFFFFGTSKKK